MGGFLEWLYRKSGLRVAGGFSAYVRPSDKGTAANILIYAKRALYSNRFRHRRPMYRSPLLRKWRRRAWLRPPFLLPTKLELLTRKDD
jgi:hypothetical protein